MGRVRIEFSQEELEAIWRRRAVKRLALFGSVSTMSSLKCSAGVASISMMLPEPRSRQSDDARSRLTLAARLRLVREVKHHPRHHLGVVLAVAQQLLA